MSTYFVLRLIPPRPSFAEDMTDEERAIMAAHAAHWREVVEAGKMVVFGPVIDGTGSWGLAVVETDDEAAVVELSRTDPVITSGLGSFEMGKMLGGFVRPRPAAQKHADVGAVQSA